MTIIMTTDVITAEERELQAEMTTALHRWLQLLPEPPSIAEAWEEAWRRAWAACLDSDEVDKLKRLAYTHGCNDTFADWNRAKEEERMIPVPPGVPR